MGYRVIPEEKFVCVWSDDAPGEEIAEYIRRGYSVAYFVRGRRPVREVLRQILIDRC